MFLKPNLVGRDLLQLLDRVHVVIRLHALVPFVPQAHADEPEERLPAAEADQVVRHREPLGVQDHDVGDFAVLLEREQAAELDAVAII